jgi:hypothetical protein
MRLRRHRGLPRPARYRATARDLRRRRRAAPGKKLQYMQRVREERQHRAESQRQCQEFARSAEKQQTYERHDPGGWVMATLRSARRQRLGVRCYIRRWPAAGAAGNNRSGMSGRRPQRVRSGHPEEQGQGGKADRRSYECHEVLCVPQRREQRRHAQDTRDHRADEGNNDPHEGTGSMSQPGHDRVNQRAEVIDRFQEADLRIYALKPRDCRSDLRYSRPSEGLPA